MQSRIAATLLIVSSLALVNVRAEDNATAAAPQVKAQTICPVMGGEVNPKLYVDAEGKRIYVCCQGCIAPLKADPAKYIKQLEDQGVTLAKLQTTCPVMGGKVNPKLHVDADGKRIYVCCGGCIGPVKADPAKYIKLIEEKGEVVADTPVPTAKP